MLSWVFFSLNFAEFSTRSMLHSLPLRLCLFWVKITSGNAFPYLWVFGCAWKMHFPEMHFSCPVLGCKLISIFILPSNTIFRKTERELSERERGRRERKKSPHAERERERGRTISQTCKGRKIAPSIAISPSHRSQSREAQRRSRLRLHCAISPLVEPSRLSLFLLLSIWPNLMIFFSGFCLCFCIEE